MARSSNAQLAVDLFHDLRRTQLWTPETAWQGIARLLLSCEIWASGWRPFHDVVVFRERNDFKVLKKGPNAVLRRAGDLTTYLAEQLGVTREMLCKEIGLYWRQIGISSLQPNNLLGHAFRSLIVTTLETYGDPAISYEEEAEPHSQFPGFHFTTRSKDAKLDIVARRNGQIVALMSTRWRFRHDRVDLVDEALAYAPAARRQNPHCQLYAVIGEFDPDRILKVLCNCPPLMENAALSAAVHFAPQLLWNGLRENGKTEHLRSLHWLIQQTHQWG